MIERLGKFFEFTPNGALTSSLIVMLIVCPGTTVIVFPLLANLVPCLSWNCWEASRSPPVLRT